jgi:hypothetical protein
LLQAAGCSGNTSSDSERQSTEAARRWDSTVGEYLLGPLWEPAEAYDAGHALMIPLHHAFENGNSRQQAAFAAHFDSFADNSADLADNLITRLQYLYLVTQFLVLASDTGQPELVNDRLPKMLADEFVRLWQTAPIWQWDREPFTGMQQRLDWKLLSAPTEPSYYRGITDEEFFLLAIAADLATVRRAWSEVDAAGPAIDTALDFAYRVFTAETVATAGGGWLMQPGVWEDHRDYAYAGHFQMVPGMQPMPVPGIAEDSAHAHRMAAWLTSLRRGTCSSRPAESERYRELRLGLERQFLDVVVVRPSAQFPGFRLTNFMDGRNGVYRWEYATQGPDNGYGPYQLSGMFLYGWWAFLRTPAVAAVHAEQASVFPLSADLVATYVGPNTTRERNPLTRLPDFYTNGFAALLMEQAATLPLDDACAL